MADERTKKVKELALALAAQAGKFKAAPDEMIDAMTMVAEAMTLTMLDKVLTGGKLAEMLKQQELDELLKEAEEVMKNEH